MKRICINLFIFLQLYSLGTMKAQQDPMYSMYMFDKVLINPAYTGSSNWLAATLKYRNQFTGLNGHPTTQTFNIHSPIQKKHIGVGFKLINDKVAVMSKLNAAMLFSYHLNFAGGKLSVGLEAGIYNRRIDYSKLILNDLGDDVIPANSVSSVIPDASFGIYYQKKQFYAGVSNYHLIKKSFNEHTPSKGDSYLYNHIYFIAGNVFSLDKKWSVEPSVLLKYQPSSVAQLDLNATLYYNDRIGAGFQYRTGDAVCMILRLGITEGLRISYSYDVTTSKLSSYARGAHELIITYGIKLPPPPIQKEIHPRYYF
jgi:type IX secretion system PorP/SprF family membrane protein